MDSGQRALALRALEERVKARMNSMSEIERAELLRLVVVELPLHEINDIEIELGVPLSILRDAKPIS